MNTLLSKIVITIVVLFSFTLCQAQIENAKTETVIIYGNCGMCESKIKKAGNIKEMVQVEWDVNTSMATITYDAKQTNQDAILKRIALSGYDSDKFSAPDDVYAKLPGCCQYDRANKAALQVQAIPENYSNTANHSNTSPSSSSESMNDAAEVQVGNQLKVIFDNYFEIKDALVNSDSPTASKQAAVLVTALNAVKIEVLTTNERTVWMKVMKDIKKDAKNIADTKDVKRQRDYFDTLSLNIYDLIKVSKQKTPTYYQFCPMANDGKGASWLSKESAIKNPYYGAMMLGCGKIKETIK
jgi:hypothetical protein